MKAEKYFKLIYITDQKLNDAISEMHMVKIDQRLAIKNIGKYGIMATIPSCVKLSTPGAICEEIW